MTVAGGGRSAVIASIPLPAPLAAIREAGDASAAVGVPPHVTILFPFLPAGSLSASVRSDLAAVAASAEPFTAGFSRVERREGMVWLVPDDQAPFLALTAAVASRWPGHPPYGGIHERLIAHLTLLETDDGDALDRTVSIAREVLPFEVEVVELIVIAEDSDGRWSERWRLGLGAS